MIYQFLHYPTPDGRRVRFRIARSELERVERAGLLNGESLLGAVEIFPTETAGEVVLSMTPGTARIFADALASVGGDAAVSARMLAEALDGMALELRMGRAVTDLVQTGRRGRPTAHML